MTTLEESCDGIDELDGVILVALHEAAQAGCWGLLQLDGAVVALRHGGTGCN